MLILAADSQFIYEAISATGEITISYRLWVAASVFALGAALTVFGWYIRRTKFIGYGAFVGFAFLAFMLPSIFLLDSATVSDHGMTLRTGFWSQIEHHFNYDEINTVHLTETTYENRDGVVEQHECMYCETMNGETTEVRVSDRLDRTAFRYFLFEIEKRNIPVIDHRKRNGG